MLLDWMRISASWRTEADKANVTIDGTGRANQLTEYLSTLYHIHKAKRKKNEQAELKNAEQQESNETKKLYKQSAGSSK